MSESTNKVLPAQELAAFFESVSMLLKAGVPANECPDIIASDMEEGVLAEVARGLDKMLTEGDIYILSEALEKSGSFPDYAVEMVRLGEEAGRLETTTESLGGYYRRQDELNRSIRSAISGPLLLLVIMGVVLLFLIIFVLPVFEDVFASFGIASGGGLNGAFLAARVSVVVVGLLLATVLGLVVVYLLPGGRQRLIHLTESFPLTRKIHYAISASRLTHGLEMMLASGISVSEAIDKVSGLIDNKKIAAKLPACKDEVEAGEDLGKALVNSKVLEGFEAKVLLSASRAGQTESAMRNLSEIYSSEAENGIDSLLGMVEPALVGILSFAIGFILLSVMLPLTSIMTAIG